MAALPLYSPGRWFERRRGTTEELFTDLLSLALSFDDIVNAGRDQFSVDVPGGRWIGDLVKVERMPALSVQNFWETDYADRRTA